MAKFIEIVETEEQKVNRQALSIVTKVVRECSQCTKELRELVKRSGGKAAFLEMVGDKAAGLTSAYAAIKNFIESVSDLSVDSL